MKKSFFIAAAAVAAAIATQASAALTVTEVPFSVVPAGQTVICNGTAAMCSLRLPGSGFTYVTAPDSSPAILTDDFEEVNFDINQVIKSLSFVFYVNGAENDAKIILGNGVEVFIFGGNYSPGSTRINFAFSPGDEQLVKAIKFYNGLGSNMFGSIATDVGAPVAGVPESSSWAMMIAGFGLVGASMRRRQSHLAVA